VRNIDAPVSGGRFAPPFARQVEEKRTVPRPHAGRRHHHSTCGTLIHEERKRKSSEKRKKGEPAPPVLYSFRIRLGAVLPEGTEKKNGRSEVSSSNPN